MCNGAMSQAMIDRFRANGTSGPHSASPANEARWALMKDHPTAAEIALAAERFNERLHLLQTLTAQGLEYPRHPYLNAVITSCKRPVGMILLIPAGRFS